jgi:hypothetical protein
MCGTVCGEGFDGGPAVASLPPAVERSMAVGAEFGGRGHDTVSHAVGVVRERAAAYQSANDALSILRNELREAAAKIA